jgi:GntR family transcriptional regulator
VKEGARKLLLKAERQKFLAEEWPRIYETIQRLGLKAEELLEGQANGQTKNAAAAPKATEEEH